MNTLQQFDAQEATRKATDRLIKAERKRVTQAAEEMGQRLLDERRRLGAPEPDGQEWGLRMTQYQIGLRVLAIALQEPDFRVEDTPPRLREWLAHPLLDRPATDDDLRTLVDLLTEHEKKVREQDAA